MANTVQIVVNLRDNASGALGKITSGLSGMASVAGGIVAANVIGRIGEGFAGVASTGFNFNRSIENATAKLNAFTKDANVSQGILRQLREEANKTPFAFEDMASAGTALLPVANMLNMDLMDLVGTAEILGALNPAEGLAGAAFALKEAASGDFTSIIERFDLPRQYINKLKDEGVPNIEIVRRAMQEMGLDMDLVSNMAETFDGRWSTLMDTFQGIAAAFTDPIFDWLSEQLVTVQNALNGTGDATTQFATDWGENVVTGLQIAKDAVITFKDAWKGEWVDSDVINPIHRAVGNFATGLADFKLGVSNFFTTLKESWEGKWVDSEIIEPMDRLAGITAGALREGWDALVGLWSKAKDLWASGWIQENILMPLQDLATFLQEDGSKAVEEFNQQLGPLNDLLLEWNKLMDAANDYRQTWIDLGERINEITGRNNDLQLTGNQRWETTITLGGIIKGIMGGLTGIFNSLGDSVKWVTDKLKEMFDWAIRARDAIGQAIDSFGDASASNFQDTTSGGSIAPPVGGGGSIVPGGGGPGGNNPGVDTRGAMGGGVVVYATINNQMDIEEMAYRISKIQAERRL
jgi:hypothetical protein